MNSRRETFPPPTLPNASFNLCSSSDIVSTLPFGRSGLKPVTGTLFYAIPRNAGWCNLSSYHQSVNNRQKQASTTGARNDEKRAYDGAGPQGPRLQIEQGTGDQDHQHAWSPGGRYLGVQLRRPA